MKIGIIGGTGGMGKGFALRWSQNHDILIGSRDESRASAAAQEYANTAGAFGHAVHGITGGSNASVAEQSDVLVLSIPYDKIDAVCPDVCSRAKNGCIIVSPIVPMTKTDAGFEFIPMKDGSPTSHQMVAKHLKEGTRLVSAFHVISEKKLANPELDLDYDIFVCGDDADATSAVNRLISEIKGLRPVYLGPGRLSYLAEAATPLLLNAMVRNKMKNPGIRLV